MAETIKEENLKIWQIKDLRITKTEIKIEESNKNEIPICQNYVILNRCSAEKDNLFRGMDLSNFNMNEYKEFGIELCRVCLKQGIIPIHGNKPDEDLASALLTFGGVIVNIFDSYPKYLCESCHSVLKSAMVFRQTAQSSDQLFREQISGMSMTTNIMESISNKALNIKKTDEINSNALDEMTDYKSDLDNDEYTEDIPDTPSKMDLEICLNPDKNESFIIEPVESIESTENPVELGPITNILETKSIKKTPTAKNQGHEFTCKKCDIQFDTFQEYRVHKLSLTKHKKKMCTKCKHMYASHCIKTLNKKTKKYESKYVCTTCYEGVGKVIDKRDTDNYDIGKLNNGVAVEQKSILGCRHCDIEFDTYEDFEEHKLLTRRHKKHICAVCNKKVAVRFVKKYLKSTNNKGIFMCNVCYSKDSITIVKELKLQYPGRSSKPTKQKTKLKCKECDATFSSRQELKVHNVEHRQKRVLCTICNKSFTQNYMKIHMLTHNLPSYICDICGRQFKQQPSLLYHTRIHSDNLPYKCSVCPYRTRLSSSLRIHMRTHTGEKPYQCEECPKKFLTKSNLNKHSITHKAGYSFMCECGKGYRGKIDLESHISMVHTGINNYLCDQCDKAFSNKKKLMNHQRHVHKREKLRSGKCPVYLTIDSMNKQQINTNEENKGDANV